MSKFRITRGRYTGTVGTLHPNGNLQLADDTTLSVTRGVIEAVSESTALVTVENGKVTPVHRPDEAMRVYHQLAQGGFTDAKVDEYNRRFKSKGYEVTRERRGLLGRGVSHVLRRRNG